MESTIVNNFIGQEGICFMNQEIMYNSRALVGFRLNCLDDVAEIDGLETNGFDALKHSDWFGFYPLCG